MYHVKFMEQLAALIVKGAGVIGSLAMAALLRYLEKTSLIRKYKRKIDELTGKVTEEKPTENN